MHKTLGLIPSIARKKRRKVSLNNNNNKTIWRCFTLGEKINSSGIKEKPCNYRNVAKFIKLEN